MVIRLRWPCVLCATVPTETASPRAGGCLKQSRTSRSFGGRMALLIIELDKHIGNAKAWRDTFKEQLPDLAIRIWPDAGELSDIEYLAFMPPRLPEFESYVQPCGRSGVLY